MFSNFDDEYYAQPSTSNNYNNNQRLSLDSGIGLDDLLDQSTSSCCSTAESPPTKWPRISTPPAKKPDVIIDEKGNMLTTFEAVNRTMALFSPPNRNRRTPFTSPNSTSFNSSSTLRTPKPGGISICLSTPSPFRVTISRTPLKLSNNENVAGYHIGREEDVKTIGDNQHVVRCTGIINPKRCLIPGQETPEKKTPFEGFNELPIDMTPGKLNEALCQGDEMGFLNYPSTSYDPMLNDLAVPTPTKPKIPEQPSFAIITQQPIRQKPRKRVGNPTERQKLDREIEKWSLEPFVTPEKDLKVNCAQWIVVSTGKTRAQRELFGEATRFLGRRRVTTTTNQTSPKKIPTICRVGLFKHRYARKTSPKF